MLIATRLFALTLVLAAAMPVAAAAEHEAHPQPQTVDYALILPANLPHLLRLAADQAESLGLDSARREDIRRLMAQAPSQVFERLSRAEHLEKEIARDVLLGALSEADLHARLDALVQFKRAATEAQIRTIGHLRALMPPERFHQLLESAISRDDVSQDPHSHEARK